MSHIDEVVRAARDVISGADPSHKWLVRALRALDENEAASACPPPEGAEVEEIVREVAKAFPCFGGGNETFNNPISHVLKDKPAQFALGVDVREVVTFICGRLSAARAPGRDRT